METKTFGAIVQARREALRISKTLFVASIRKEDGEHISLQYLKDIERDRRDPSWRITQELARALSLDAGYLHALLGRTPPDVGAYLREHPETLRSVAAFFARARATGFTAWTAILPEETAVPPAAASG